MAGTRVSQLFRRAPSRCLAYATAVSLLLVLACTPRAPQAGPLRFSAPQGAVLNEFFRQGATAAHLVVTPGRRPRVVVAFPAGNSGAAIWFEAAAPLSWQPAVRIQAQSGGFGESAGWRGISAELAAQGGPIRIEQAILGSMRVIRDYQQTGSTAPEVSAAARVTDNELVWQRRRLDGAAGYYLRIQVLTGSVASQHGSAELIPNARGRLRLRITALTGDTPLTPIDEDQTVTASAAADANLRRILAFLSYEEKLLAGSFRFNTYFGRDTLMTLLLLTPVLQPGVVEAGLRAVLERLNEAGEVAHEEDIGEYALLRRLRAGLPVSDAPLLDYKMVDDDFMLAPVAAAYLLRLPVARARAFLQRTTREGATYGALLVRNLRFVVARAGPFAREPAWQHLIPLQDGERVGNWRDSEDGLGGGRFAYDVNGLWVPAALEAIGRLIHSGVLQPYLSADTSSTLSPALSMAKTWRQEAPGLFEVRITSEVARASVEAYARSIGIDPAPALFSLNGVDPVGFHAIALDHQGQAVPIVHSDESLSLLLFEPALPALRHTVETLMRPLPAGLMTEVGMVAANPAFAAALAPRFDNARYHGTVIWSWQQAVLLAGLDHQLARTDLDAPSRALLTQASGRLRAALSLAKALRGAELWSWSTEGGRYRLQPFGQRQGDETESNAAQLWSTIYLRPRATHGQQVR